MWSLCQISISTVYDAHWIIKSSIRHKNNEKTTPADKIKLGKIPHECYGIFSMVIPLDNHNLSVLLRSHENVIVIKKTSSGAKYFSFSDCLSYSLTRSQHVVVLIIDLWNVSLPLDRPNSPKEVGAFEFHKLRLAWKNYIMS